MKLLAKLSLFVLIVICLPGCANFERDWRHSLHHPPAPAGSIAGPWQGKWLSHVNGHTGDLRCLVTPLGQDEYEFRFKATYWKVFKATYTVHMPVDCTNDTCKFSGQENLGLLAGGTYHYDGGIQGTNLNATYRNKFDHGVFEMSRP